MGIQVLNQDGLANAQIRLLIVEKCGASDAAKAAKEDLLLMLRPDALGKQETLPLDPEDEETDPRR